MRAAISEVKRGCREIIEEWERNDRRSSRSPAAKVMDEAVDLAIEGHSPIQCVPRSSTLTLLRPATKLSVLRMKGCRLFSFVRREYPSPQAGTHSELVEFNDDLR